MLEIIAVAFAIVFLVCIFILLDYHRTDKYRHPHNQPWKEGQVATQKQLFLCTIGIHSRIWHTTQTSYANGSKGSHSYWICWKCKKKL